MIWGGELIQAEKRMPPTSAAKAVVVIKPELPRSHRDKRNRPELLTSSNLGQKELKSVNGK